MTKQAALLAYEADYACGDGFRMPTWLCRPQQEDGLPGIVFVHEAFGLNDEMKRLAREIASAGYVVAIPDLFGRGSWLGCIKRLMKDLRNESGTGIDDLLAVREWLRNQSFVDPNRIGVLGLCLGGGLAMVLAKSGLFQVAAPFYGPVPQSLQGACPLVASFGAKDRVMTPDAARLEAELRRQNTDHDVKVYPDAGHSFMNRAPNRFIGMIGKISPIHAQYDANAASDAMERVKGFLASHL
jgi:carboxymethylenebutenolidase